MNRNDRKKSITLEDKVGALAETVDSLAISVAKGFENLDKRITDEFGGVNKRLEDIEYRLGKIESNHERRLDILEERMAVIKTYFEKNLKVKF